MLDFKLTCFNEVYATFNILPLTENISFTKLRVLI